MQPTDEDGALSPKPRVIDPPDAIWLVYGYLEHDDTHRECCAGGEVTWCEDGQFDGDVRYVRADLLAAAVASERERWSDAVRALMCGDLGVQTRHKMEDGHGADTADGKAWLRALRMLSEDTRPAADDLAAKIRAAKENP